MNWDAIGALAELLSALGVIASLVYRSWSPGAITRIASALSRLQNPAAPSLVARNA